MMATFMRVLKACISSKYSKCISAIKRLLYTTAMYISSSSFVYLCFSLCCDACLKSSVLRVGVKTLHNTHNGLLRVLLFPRRGPHFDRGTHHQHGCSQRASCCPWGQHKRVYKSITAIASDPDISDKFAKQMDPHSLARGGTLSKCIVGNVAFD